MEKVRLFSTTTQDAHVRGIKVLLHPPRCLASCGICFHHHDHTVRPAAE